MEHLELQSIWLSDVEKAKEILKSLSREEAADMTEKLRERNDST